MLASDGGASNRRPNRIGRAALVTLAAVAVAACSNAGDGEPTGAARSATTAPRLPAEPVGSSVATSPPTSAAVTAAPSTTPVTSTSLTSPATTTSATTAPTTAPTTSTTLVVEAPAPQPIAPPLDEYAAEPVIELGSISIPKLSVDMTMYEGIRLTTLDRGPGHWPGSAMPGEVGNVVVGGHRVSTHQVFRNVDQLVRGDEIFFRDAGVEHRYLVDRVEIVEPTAIWIVDPTETATATLFACHPPGSTAQRIVVFADLADSTQPGG